MKKLFIAICVIILAGAGYIGFKLYSNYQKMNEIDKKIFQAIHHEILCIGKAPKAAESCYRKAIAIDPYHFDAYFVIARLKAENKDCCGSLAESKAGIKAFQAYMKLDKKIIRYSRVRSFFMSWKRTMKTIVTNCKLPPEKLAEANKLLNELP